MGTEFPRIPGFKLVEQCGRGGSGTVYLGVDCDGIHRAIRVLRPDPERPEQREVEAAAIAAYRNIAREQKHLIDILYIGRGRDFLYYIMPLADSERDPRCRYKPRTLAGEISAGREVPRGRSCASSTRSSKGWRFSTPTAWRTAT